MHNVHHYVKELMILKTVQKLAVAEENHGDKKELVVLDKVQLELLNGVVEVSYSDLLQEAML